MVPFFRNRNTSSFLVSLFFAGILSSCRIQHNPVPVPNLSVPQSYAGLTNVARTDSANIGEVPYQTLFTDPNLVALIDTGLARNLDLKIALQRIDMARANYGISQGALLPRVDAVATAGVDRYGRYTLNGVGNYDTNFSPNITGDRQIPNPTPDYFVGLRSSWEIDVWGKLRNRRRAAYTRVLASQEGRNLIVTSLTADLARLYYSLLALDAELVPQKAVFEVQDKNYVYVVDAANKVKSRSFVPQARVGQNYIVRSGLQPGDRVVYEGIQNIRDGDQIIPSALSADKLTPQNTLARY